MLPRTHPNLTLESVAVTVEELDVELEEDERRRLFPEDFPDDEPPAEPEGKDGPPT